MHNIKGVSANLHINALYLEAKALEQRLKLNQLDITGDGIDHMERILEQYKIVIKKEFGRFDLDI